jgi:DNA-damage-inducible protein D
MAKKSTPPDRIRGFTSLADHEAATHEGKVIEAEHAGFRFRRIWHEGEWWHSVVDVVGALVESADPKDYWAQTKGRMRKEEGAEQSLTNCQQLKLPSADGKNYKTDCAKTEDLFRIIQSVPSPRAEPIKRFLAQVGAERLEEIAQPSKIVDRAIETYRNQGRDDDWIDGRLQNISARNELTDEWKGRGAEGVKAAPITEAMHKEMLGHTPTEHRRLKRLGKQHELRDHCDGLELAITTLGERAAKTIIVERDTKTFQDTKAGSIDGAQIAGEAARKIEKAIGRPIASKSSFLTSEQRLIAEQEEQALLAAEEEKKAEKLRLQTEAAAKKAEKQRLAEAKKAAKKTEAATRRSRRRDQAK